MKLEHLNEATGAVSTVAGVPFETRIRLGLIHAESALRCVRSAAFTAQQAKISGMLDTSVKAAILETIWEELVSPS